jgi:hypothetical protein
VTIDASIAVAVTVTVAMAIGMTVDTIFVSPVGLDICQRPLDVEKHISLLSPNSREGSRRYFPSAPASFHILGGRCGHTLVIITMPPFP